MLNRDSTLQGSWTHEFSPSLLNEARVQWNWYQFNVDTNDRGGPGLDVQGYGFFGRGIFLPSHTTARRYELSDNVTYIRGHHSMRMGFYELLRGNNTVSDTFFAGRFEFLDLPGELLSPCLEAPAACNLATTAPSEISTLQSWGYGLPAFYEQGFGDPQYGATRPFTAAYWQDAWQISHGFTLNYGLRYELDSQSGPLNTYKKNFAPRVSFAWDPFNDHHTVIRGGYGIYYSPIYFQIPDVVKTLGDINGTRQIANALVSILGVPGSLIRTLAPRLSTRFCLRRARFCAGHPLQDRMPASERPTWQRLPSVCRSTILVRFLRAPSSSSASLITAIRNRSRLRWEWNARSGECVCLRQLYLCSHHTLAMGR